MAENLGEVPATSLALRDHLKLIRGDRRGSQLYCPMEKVGIW